MTVYEQLIDKGFAEKLTELELVKSAARYVSLGRLRWGHEITLIEEDLAEIVSEVTFD